MKAQMEWLTGRVEAAPTSYLANEGGSALRTRMAWQKLKQQAGEGDEIWAFTNPGSGWRQTRQSGFALVRDGAILESVLIGPD